MQEKSLITEPLGLYGWRPVESVLLAALLSEEPLLLVGAHGCAKSFVLERLAESLGLAFRSYNASLLNYDDLVGVPLPNATRTRLDYLASPESIWGAEVVFVDEISRTRPELQNKLFPIIYDRRVQGRPMPKLVYRWAAMNPPPTDEELEQGEALYVGSEPLDAALADRFPFILSVPDWDELSTAEQEAVLADQFAGRHDFPVPIHELVAEARAQFEALVPALTPRLTPYIITLATRLRALHYDVSTRRATMLLRCAIAVHAARLVLAQRLETEVPELADSAWLSLLNTLPDRARRRLKAAELTAVFRMAWAVGQRSADDPVAQLLKVTDPVARLRLMVTKRLELQPDRAAVVIGEGVAAAKSPLRRGLTLAVYLALREQAALPASTVELLAQEAMPALAPAEEQRQSNVWQQSQQLRRIGEQIAEVNQRHGETTALARHHANLLNSFVFEKLPDEATVVEISQAFERLWQEFKL